MSWNWYKSFSRSLQRSYASEWICVALLATAYLFLALTEPFHRMFSLDDRRIQYPHAKIERVPVPMLFVYAAGIPLLVLTLYIVLVPQQNKRLNIQKCSKSHWLHVTLLGLVIALLSTSVFTDLVKNGVGRPRPDLISRCKPREGTPEHELVSYNVCTEANHHTLHDGFRSFPSGHSSFAFSGLGYLTFFLIGQLNAFHWSVSLARCIIAVLPILGALWIAVSRTEDYRHDVYDVTTGAIIGMSIGYFSYRRVYPSFSSQSCACPYFHHNENGTQSSSMFQPLDNDDIELHAVRSPR